MWHSCVARSLEELFARSTPESLALARRYVAILSRLGDVQILAQKTRLVCVARVRFAGLLPRRHGFEATFALTRRLTHPRVTRVDDYGPRWLIHHVPVRAEADLDAWLEARLRESYREVGTRTR